MPSASARLEHPQQLISIVTHAIRAAALAPSEREALDIVGGALSDAVALLKSESNQRSEAVLCLFSTN
ncbi:hypothetical protein AB1286_30040 [Trinickia sp. NRRL B-1857]|uniref:hypothetical protein n=1 Tax=Trinickia sp. NRRL B-1857 TaxID=3162879 RepID=UPI003D26B8C7